MSKNYNIFFDLGSTKIRAAAFSKNSNDEQISFEKKCTSSFKKDNLDIKNLNKSLEILILDLEKKTNEYIERANILIDSVDSINLTLSISKKGDSKKLSMSDIELLAHNAKQEIIKYNKDIEILHILITNFKIDGKDYSSIQIDKEYQLLSVDILFICFPKNILDEISHLFKKNHIFIENFIGSSYAKTFSYKDKFTTFQNLVFIELGYEKTSIVSYKNEYLESLNIIPIGGNHITKDISKILKISDEESEKIKKEFNNQELFSENLNIQKKLLNNLKQNNLDHEEFSLMIKEIIFARIDEILNLSLKLIDSIKMNKLNEKYKIILIGSGAKIFENNSISITQKDNLLDEFEFFRENPEIICKTGENLLFKKNLQEVFIVPKQEDVPGFFVRFFNLFK